MPVKDFFRKMQPVQLYVVLILTILFFITELIVSHLTHALTLLMDSYHMLCNILALAGCITTIKYSDTSAQASDRVEDQQKNESTTTIGEEITLKTECQDRKGKKDSQSKQERKLRNTFGWTRIDIMSMLICCVFLASFCFSIYIEALQTLFHIDHQDAMHHPVSVLCIGSAGLLLNGLCYLLIGGFTFHQGSFLYVTETGDVVLNKIVVNDSVKMGARRLSRTGRIFSSPPNKRQGIWEMIRDIIGCTVVIICSIAVIFTDKEHPEISKYIDPMFSLLSATCIMFLSYPYMKESCMILLQTMPDTININTMKKELVNNFPDIINVHDFHIWQLTASKVISTVHIIFENPKIYRNIMEDIKEFFQENGVTQVTIQPEFFNRSISTESLISAKLPPMCLVSCQGEMCKLNHCCPSYEDLRLFRTSSKDVLPKPEPATPVLKSVRIIDEELHSLRSSISTYSINSLESTHELHKSISGKISEVHMIKEEDAVIVNHKKVEANVIISKTNEIEDYSSVVNQDTEELVIKSNESSDL
ncbi:zinc transporter 1 [Anthonomus grandis grandis]|uniref:zinc transporter 1 n=1 Tax=Anthonomus grandis grandis TaxID=2921223 RepID=UPI00216572E1|nr:zinc transporter 1 [Anthonomus grandis grandis]XP_050299319.1 zinc transporter 1 [Anthonomus grandis grandis]XP_050299320.1 zinc transporter 1 [Anthonomus grandis grandis]XP_050299321.1 zinc transporter 1 [Anthonomus grandis grandis]